MGESVSMQTQILQIKILTIQQACRNKILQNKGIRTEFHWTCVTEKHHKYVKRIQMKEENYSHLK